MSAQIAPEVGIEDPTISTLPSKTLGVFSVTSPLRLWCTKTIAPGTWFDNAILILILVNSITMGMTDYSVVDDENLPAAKGWMVGETFDKKVDNGANAFVSALEIPFLLLFTMEMITKLIALGFMGHPSAYINDGWNKLDFTVVFVGWLGLLAGDLLPINLGVLRSFRILRPLRSISRLPGLKRVINSLITAIPQLLDLLILVAFALIIFSILGMQLFSGKMHNVCRATPFPVRLPDAAMCSSNLTTNYRSLDCWETYMDTVQADLETWRCQASEFTPKGETAVDPLSTQTDSDTLIKSKSGSPWNSPSKCHWPLDPDGGMCSAEGGMGKSTCGDGSWCGSNFDPFGNLRFVDTVTPYGFPLMKSGTWSEDYNWGITQFDNIGQSFVTIFQAVSEEGWTDIMYAVMDVDGTVSAYIVFMLLIFCGSFFLMNLFLAAIGIEDEEEEEEEEGGGGDAEEEEKEKEAHTGLAAFVNHAYFGNFIVCCILLNTVTLSMDSFPEPGFMSSVENVNVILSYIFIVEMLLKLPALGIKGYFSDAFNVFDCAIVCVSIVEIIIAMAGDGEGGASGLSALRTFRLFRVFKLAKEWNELQILLVAIVRTAFDIANFAVLLGLFMYIMALVGMQFFANEMHFDTETGEKIAFNDDFGLFNSHGVMENIPRNHFDNLLWSLTTIFQFLSGENWNSVMYDCFRAIGWGGVIYSLAVFVFGVMIVMNLFLAILLSNFEGNDDMIKVDVTESTTDVQIIAKEIDPNADPDAFIATQTNSFFVLTPENPFRKKCEALAASKNFESFIIVLILFSSFTLGIDDPLAEPVGFLQTLDVIMTLIFTGEFLVKAIALGFILHKGSYMRSGWNVMDFVIVVISMFALFNIGPGKSLRALRTIRVLRPLRMVQRMPELKLVVDALLNSVGAICNVAMICFLFFLIFAILGVNLFKGVLYACGGDAAYGGDECPFEQEGLCDFVVKPRAWNDESVQASWFDGETAATCAAFVAAGATAIPTSKEICDCVDPSAWGAVLPRSFDNVGDALVLLYELSSTEGWVDYMYATVDSEGVDMHPTRYTVNDDGSYSYADKSSTKLIILFYVMFIVVGSFFVVNLFVGVVIDNFNALKAAADGGSVFMTAEQQEWANTKKFLQKLKPKRKLVPPTNGFRKTMWDILEITKPVSFDAFIMGCIIGNSLVMAMEFHGMSDGYRLVLELINYLFAAIFTIEMFIKVTALGFPVYIRDAWNKFDCLIVIGTDVGLVLFFVAGIEVGSISSVVRMCRIGRIFRLINSAKSLNHYFNTIITSLPSLYNIGLLLFLLFFIYSVMAVQIFSKVRFNDDYGERANFRNFGNSMATLFRFSTGENWNGFMHSILAEKAGETCHMDPPLPRNSVFCFASGLEPCETQVTYENIQLMTDKELAGIGEKECCVELYGCGDAGWAYFFFYSFTLSVTFVLLNLFLGVILEAFDDNETGDSLTPGELDLFCEDWCSFDNHGTGEMLVSDVMAFMQVLDKPMGFGEDYVATDEELHMRLEECGVMSIEVDAADGREKVTIMGVVMGLAKRVVKEKLGTDAEVELLEGDEEEEESTKASLVVRNILLPHYSSSAAELDAKVQLREVSKKDLEERKEVLQPILGKAAEGEAKKEEVEEEKKEEIKA